jgi:hypothetical protein
MSAFTTHPSSSLLSPPPRKSGSVHLAQGPAPAQTLQYGSEKRRSVCAIASIFALSDFGSEAGKFPLPLRVSSFTAFASDLVNRTGKLRRPSLAT